MTNDEALTTIALCEDIFGEARVKYMERYDEDDDAIANIQLALFKAENALVKRIPHKVNVLGGFLCCPKCTRHLGVVEDLKDNYPRQYCEWCGQALDWSDNNA